MNLKNKKGAALVEMAIILPLLFLIVFGIFEFGRAMFITNTLNNAAREGARRAAVSPKPINVETHVKDCIPFDKTELEIDPVSPTTGPNPSVTVRLRLPFHTVTQMIPGLDGIKLKGEATMRYEL